MAPLAGGGLVALPPPPSLLSVTVSGCCRRLLFGSGLEAEEAEAEEEGGSESGGNILEAEVRLKEIFEDLGKIYVIRAHVVFYFKKTLKISIHRCI